MTGPVPDPIQDKCKYGWVLPDRCRYNPRLGCDCGAYPALKWDDNQKKYVPVDFVLQRSGLRHD